MEESQRSGPDRRRARADEHERLGERKRRTDPVAHQQSLLVAPQRLGPDLRAHAEVIARRAVQAQREAMAAGWTHFKMKVGADVEGDMRRAINALQGASMQGSKVTSEMVYKSASRAEPAEIKEMMELALARKFIDARKKLHKLIVEYGMSGEDVLLQMYRTVDQLSVDERQKVTIVDKIGEYNFRLVEGANETLQIEALLAQLLMVK